jgi:prepilin-type N-terminal cleavage/methylation domain-containing protein
VTAGRRPRADEGFTLMEVVVTLTIFSVVMAVVTGAFLQIYQATNKIDNSAAVRDQLGNSFQRLDKELRYASWVSLPGQVNNRWYLEYALPGGCRQLVFDNGRLTLASWTLPGTTPGTPTTIASNLSLIPSTPPFTVYAADPNVRASTSPGPVPGMGADFEPEHTQVRLRFNGTVGTTTLAMDVMFTAQNNNRSTPLLNDCSEGRPNP